MRRLRKIRESKRRQHHGEKARGNVKEVVREREAPERGSKSKRESKRVGESESVKGWKG